MDHRPIDRLCLCTQLCLIVALVVGCAAGVVSPEDPKASIPDRSVSIVLGQMDRRAVRAVLGNPLLASAEWGFDLFRADTEQSEVMVAVTPLPIPFARVTDQIQRFTLVRYDDRGHTTAVETGIFRRPAKWRNVAPIRRDFSALHLRAGDLMFFVDPEGARQENLLAAPARRDAFLERQRTSTGCTVVLGCGDHGCPDQLALDAGEVRPLPLRPVQLYWASPEVRDRWLRGVDVPAGAAQFPWLEALVVVPLAPGDHILVFSAQYLDGKHSVPLACRPGQVSYLVVHATDNGKFLGRALVDWRVESSRVMPVRFARRPLVLIIDGQWQLASEPR